MANEQARRISGCTLHFFADHGNRELMRRAGFVDGAITMNLPMLLVKTGFFGLGLIPRCALGCPERAKQDGGPLVLRGLRG